VPPISALTRIEPIHLARLEKQGVSTTGVLEFLAIDLDALNARLSRAALELKVDAPEDATVQMWWEQARTLGDE